MGRDAVAVSVVVVVVVVVVLVLVLVVVVFVVLGSSTPGENTPGENTWGRRRKVARKGEIQADDVTIKFSAARVTTTGARSRLTQLKIPMLLLLLLLPPHRYSDN